MRSYRLVLRTVLLICVPCLSNAAAPTYKAEPTRIERGKSAAVTITESSDTTCTLKGVTVESPASGISVSKLGESADGCKLSMQVLVGSGATFGAVNLPITKTPAGGGAAVLITTIPLEVTGILPEPIPPGLAREWM